MLLSAAILNYNSGFSLLLNSEMLTFFWLILYIIVLPIGFEKYIFSKYLGLELFVKNSIVLILLYFVSFLLSSLDFIDFVNFEMLGDGASKFVIKLIFILALISWLFSFLYYYFKIKTANNK